MGNNKKVIVLGGNIPHCTLIKELKDRGYYTILVDYLDNPPAKSIADIHIQESTLDQEKVLEIAQKYHPQYIVDACIDRPIPVVGYVSEKLGLFCPFGYKESLIGTNKNLMKQMMIDHQIPTSQFINITSLEQIDDINLNYPLIIKPSDASGSIGITKVDSKKDLKENVQLALKHSRSGEAIVEEFVSGMEIQVDCFISNGKCQILVIKEKRKFRTDVLTLSYGSMIPALISEEVAHKIQAACDQIVNVLHLNNCPFFLQALVDEKNISIIEFGLRIGGMLSYKMIEQITGLNVISTAVDAYTECTPSIRINPIKTIYTTNHIFPKKGVVASVTGVNELLEKKIITDYTQFMTMGSSSDGKLESKDRIGTFTIIADNLEDYHQKMKTAIDTLDVLDADGNSIMRKDIYKL